MPSEYHWFTCSNPRLITNPYTGQRVLVPCGSCDSCKVRHITRLLPSIIREGFSHRYSYFITLTYSDDYLPLLDLSTYTPDLKFQKDYVYLTERSSDFIRFYKNVIPVLRYSDVQKFVKRLRSLIEYSFGSEVQIRYVISGDYGSTTFRPHYHGLLFFDDPRLMQSISEFVSKSWSLRVSSGQRQSIGYVDCQSAYDAGSYVAAYSQAISNLPAIYTYRDFKCKCLHSSHPSLGSLVKPYESLEEIVSKGLLEITLYDPKTYTTRKVALSPTYIYRLFPQIVSFSSLSVSERYEIYRIFSGVQNLTPFFRRLRLKHIMNVNSFFFDYITLGKKITMSQIDRKLDVLYYTVKRLFLQCSSLGVSINDYDSFIVKFLNNRSFDKLRKQCEYVDFYNLKHSTVGVPPFIDSISYNNSDVIPGSVDPSFFYKQSQLLNRLTKRKLNNSYLELHPEFKQFHS